MIKVVSKEELEKLDFKRKGVDPAVDKCMEAIRIIEVGQSILIEPEDWKRKTPLAVYISQSRSEGKLPGYYATKTLAGDAGWVVTRKS